MLPGFIQLPALLNSIIGFLILILGIFAGAGVTALAILAFLQIRKKLTGRRFVGDNYLFIQIAVAVGAVIGGVLSRKLAQWVGFVTF